MTKTPISNKDPTIIHMIPMSPFSLNFDTFCFQEDHSVNQTINRDQQTFGLNDTSYK